MQRRAFLRGGQRDEALGCQAFERAPHLIDIHRLLRCQGGDDRTAIAAAVDEAFHFQLQDGFANQRPACLHAFAQFPFDQPRPRQQRTRQNAGAQRIGDLRAFGRGNRLGGLTRGSGRRHGEKRWDHGTMDCARLYTIPLPQRAAPRRRRAAMPKARHAAHSPIG